jgi:hypothetical protein
MLKFFKNKIKFGLLKKLQHTYTIVFLLRLSQIHPYPIGAGYQ